MVDATREYAGEARGGMVGGAELAGRGDRKQVGEFVRLEWWVVRRGGSTTGS